MGVCVSLLGNLASPCFSQGNGNRFRRNESLFFLPWLDRRAVRPSHRLQRDNGRSRATRNVLLFSGLIIVPLFTVLGQHLRSNTQAIGSVSESIDSVIQSRGYASAAPPFSLPTVAADSSTIRINCGGPDYTDNGGQKWSADMDYVNGKTYDYGTAVVSGTNDPTVYQTERYASTLKYAVPLSNGTYTVTLYFAELFFTGPGQRVFDVTLEGQTVLQDFDIFAIAGAATAIRRTFTVTVSNGTLDIVGTASVNNAKFSAIKIVPSSIPPSQTDILINCGGPSYSDSAGLSWSADQYFVGGKTKTYSSHRQSPERRTLHYFSPSDTAKH